MKLPLEYNKLSEYFDALGSSSSSSVNRSIEKILRKYKARSVLDLSCGTGSQVLWLTKHGYKVIGLDLSPKLLKIARRKAQQEKINVKFVKGDMRTTKLGQFDAAITIFNAIGHLTKTDFGKAIRNINKNLKKGGLYIFDIFNLAAMTDARVTNLAMDKKIAVNNIKIRHIQYSKLSRNNGRLTSYDQFAIQENSNKPRVFKNKFTLQIYTSKELKKMLTKNGFEILGQYGIDGAKFSEKKTENILTVVKKQ